MVIVGLYRRRPRPRNPATLSAHPHSPDVVLVVHDLAELLDREIHLTNGREMRVSRALSVNAKIIAGATLQKVPNPSCLHSVQDP